MDAVNAFNQELFSLMDMKPPISRAKMILITKAAIKAIKLYKHVVQIVEKFIKKCKPEYKVPGLYVIDSIVRQSRHQFGTDKDVFGPRFSKNITATFQYLYLCPSEDKSKIVRVLNLWQKNGVFKIEIIQPLLDMAAGASSAAPVAENATNNEGSPPPPIKVSSEPPPVTTNSVPTVPQLPSSDAFAAVAQLFQSTQGQQLQQILQTFQQPPKPQSPAIDSSVMAQVQAITAQLKTATAQPEPRAAFPQPEQKTTFDKKLLDRFDYDDEPEASEDSKKEDSTPSPSLSQPPFGFAGDGVQQPAYSQLPAVDPFQQRMMGMQQDTIRHQVPLPPNGQMPGFGLLPTPPFPPMAQPAVPATPPVQQSFQAPFQAPSEPQAQKAHQQEMEVEPPCNQEVKRHVSDSRKSRSRSASRSPKRRRSRSSSRSRRSRHRRSRSRSRDRRRHSPRSRSQERREREKERERRQKGLPPIKAETASVCSTTLWVGQLDKRTTQQDVASLLEEFGPIESINMIPPRGCAYIVMVHRQDAYRALQKLSRGNYKVNQKSIKIAWALNKGIKTDYKQYWDVELGVTYIPWDKVKPEDLESFCEGGVLDNETLNPDWKGIPKKSENEVAQNGGAETTHAEAVSPLPKTLPVPVPPIPVPAPITVPPPPQVPPHQPGPPGVGALQPPTFTPPLGIPPPGFAHGVPPPPPPPFLRPGFNPMHLPPGFLPPGPPPPLTPPVSIPPPHTPPITIPNLVSGARGSTESSDGVKMYGSAAPPSGPTSLPAPPTAAAAAATQPISLLGTQGVAPGPVMGLQAPSTGLLGARPGLIPLQRPPGMPPPHLPRFPLMPPRPMPPHMLHRGPPPGPGGYGMPPPHGMKGPFPPHGPFVRPGGMPGLGGPGPGPGGPEEREGRQQQQQPPPPQQQQQQPPQQQPPSQPPPQQPSQQPQSQPQAQQQQQQQQQPQGFRNDSRHQFNSGREQERFGRRSYGSRADGDRERYGGRADDRESGGSRERREWGRRSPERDRSRDTEERNRRSGGHRDRDRDSRDREPRKEKEESRGKEKTEAADRAGGDKTLEPAGGPAGSAAPATDPGRGEGEPPARTAEEFPPQATSSGGDPKKDPGPAPEAAR
ncbi:SR-related and CTD-associated factor 4 isoform X1 [Ornithorhynchus anatinus]|uniref:SR-related CTD associated factor 4 n=1 Tax=Ornithorhynchus anatinus TaxID=9258 RepID=A0A6I8NWC2_ORNAN|nr:SR-related and CTD-associated factor 4 isoform X1 [Ornithorhynchus anatinus]